MFPPLQKSRSAVLCAVCDIGHDILSLFYPVLCSGCGKTLLKGETGLCLSCAYALPGTGFEKEPDNPVARMFWGRVPLENAAAHLYFEKGGRVQRLIHHLKYKGDEAAGEYLGREMGMAVRDAMWKPDVLLPVPITASRARNRGYNQSEVLCRGLAQILDIPCITETLVRENARHSQTRKGRYARWENVDKAFRLHDPERLSGRHILVVDDVVTTGATLEACCRELKDTLDCRLSILTLAWAKR